MSAPDWPPPLASRAERRRCKHRMKGGYCADCGTPAPKEAAHEADG